MKAVYSRNEEAAAAGAAAAAAARADNDHSPSFRQAGPPSWPDAAAGNVDCRIPDLVTSVSSTSDTVQSRQTSVAAALAPSLARNESRPGAISVPGSNATSGDEEQHDNLLEGGDDDEELGIPWQQQHQRDSILLSNLSQSSPSGEAPPTIMAELAPDDREVEERLAERLEAQMTERLHREVDRRLSQERQSHAIAEVVNFQKEAAVVDCEQPKSTVGDGSSSAASAATKAAAAGPAGGANHDSKSCGTRRTCWGVILCVLLSAIAGGVAGGVLWLSSDNGTSDSNDANTGGGPTDVSMASLAPSTAPTATPTQPLADRRWDYLLEEIGPTILPADATETGLDPADYFADTTTPQYEALRWMAALDLEYDVFDTPSQMLVERYVLAVLYYSTDGPTGWTQSLNFVTSGLAVCDWNNEGEETGTGAGGNLTDGVADGETSSTDDAVKGVVCNNGPLVTSIRISNNGLQGAVPWELSLLEYLIQVDFDTNAFSGTLPIELSSVTRLADLRFNNNSLTGPLPPEFSKITSLVNLDLSNNGLTGNLPPSWGASLTDLLFLRLKRNKIDGTLPSAWQGLTSLQLLDLEQNRLDGNIATEFGRMSELTSIFLESNLFQGTLPTEFGSLSKLENFFVYGNSLSGQVPPEYAKLTNLKYFWFHATDLTGSVDDLFCVFPVVNNLQGDCLPISSDGLPPQINCTCCTRCCNNNGTNCESMQ